jgi:hypothetical protein
MQEEHASGHVVGIDYYNDNRIFNTLYMLFKIENCFCSLFPFLYRIIYSMPTCQICALAPAVLHRSKTRQSLCAPCFYHAFETEIHNTIVDNGLFSRGERVAIGCSGGKDSTVLAEVMTTLNKRYDYGL